jgi:putative salt-induced outer membrane protein YdiY
MPSPRFTMTSAVRRALLLAGLLSGIAGSGAAAEPPPPLGWYSTSGLSFVMAAGNSSASTLGAKAEVKRLWPRSTLTIGGSAIRADASDPPRRAVGSMAGFQIETGPRTPKAAKYNASAAFDRRVTERFGWRTGAEFDRDRFSGLMSRTLGYAGVGYLLANRKDFVLKTGLAATLAHQSELVDDPVTGNTFAGLRLSADAERTLGANSTYVGGLAVDESLGDTADLRVRFANALAVSMNRRLALQVGLLLLYDHQPSFVDLPLFDAQGAPSGLTVTAPAATLDTTFTLSVVVSFAPRAAAP